MLSSRDQMDALLQWVAGGSLKRRLAGRPGSVLASPLMPSFYGVSGFENLHEVLLTVEVEPRRAISRIEH